MHKMLIAFGVACCISAHPALAQTKPITTAAPSMDSLLQAGYEIKSVNFIPLAQSKEIFGANVASSNTLITLQKGTSVAVCLLNSEGWAILGDSSMTNAVACKQR
jgi:hypothetical protein